MRILSAVIPKCSLLLSRVPSLLSSGLNAWHDFWFRPIDPLMIGAIRLLTGWMLLYNLFIWGLDLEAFFSDNGLQPLSTVRAMHEGDPVFSFWLWTGDKWLWPMHYACVAIVALFFLGVASRLTSVLAFLITISYSQRVPVANFGFDQILGFLCLYLCLAPSGACLSVDAMIRRWWSRRRGVTYTLAPSASARMASRLIQLHLCAIYLWAGLAKLKGPSWWTGEAMWRVIANEEYQTMDLTWMAQVPWLPYLIAHVTIAWEISFIGLVWLPRWRPLTLFIGMMMHLGIGAFLGMWTFGLIMAFAYLAFADPDKWRSWHSTLVSSSMVEVPELSEKHGMPHNLKCDDVGLAAVNTQPEKLPSMAAADPFRRICIVAHELSERTALRRYFVNHQFQCVAFPDPDGALTALSRGRFDVLLVEVGQFTPTQIHEFCEDVSNLSDAHVLLLVNESGVAIGQTSATIPRVSCKVLPTSLREIRSHLEKILETPRVQT